MKLLILLFVSLAVSAVRAEPILTMSEIEAEQRALSTSNELKGYVSTAAAAGEHADAQFAGLYPKLTLDADYQYLTHVPTVSLPIPGVPPLPFGSHDNYAFGPTLSYIFWDTNGARNAFRGYDLLAQARTEDKRSAERQILLSVRIAYLHLQLALEELRLLHSSLDLSRAQNHDIEANFKAGAATRLDHVDSQRDVINYQLQFEQKQAEVETDLKDLLALTQNADAASTLHPGPPGVPGTDLTIRLDSLDDSLKQTGTWSFSPPDDLQPSVRSQALQAESAERLAQSQKATLYPTLAASASAKWQYPDVINLDQVEQNTFMVTFSMPLFDGLRTHHMVAEAHQQAEAARFNEEQARINLKRDYEKAQKQLTSLRDQQKLAVLDVGQSEEAAKLYYKSYRGGKINLIDVQSANNRALTSKVNAARINAQILNQLFNLRALTGETLSHGN